MGGCGLFRAPAVHQKLARPALRGAAPPREWGSDEDTALLLGVHAHGYAAYEAVLADASLPALHGLCLHKEEKPAAAAAAAAAATAATAGGRPGTAAKRHLGVRGRSPGRHRGRAPCGGHQLTCARPRRGRPLLHRPTRRVHREVRFQGRPHAGAPPRRRVSA